MITLTLSTPTLFANLVPSKLSLALANNDPQYGEGAKAFTEAVGYSLMQTQSRVKLPGLAKFYLESGLQLFNVNNTDLVPYTDSGSVPQVFQTVMIKGGVGLPFGLSAELGLSQVINEHKLTGLSLSLAYQLLDFSTWVNSSLIPALTLNASGMRTIAGCAEMAATSQVNAGVYHRLSFAQFAYAFKYNYSLLTATTKSVGKAFISHGLTSHVPLYSDWFIRMELFYPRLSASALLSYQF